MGEGGEIEKLQFVEKLVLEKIKKGEQVLMIPIDIYTSILLFCEQTEDYETCIILDNLIDKVQLKTTFSFYDEFVSQNPNIKLLK